MKYIYIYNIHVPASSHFHTPARQRLAFSRKMGDYQVLSNKLLDYDMSCEHIYSKEKMS